MTDVRTNEATPQPTKKAEQKRGLEDESSSPKSLGKQLFTGFRQNLNQGR